MQAKLSAIVALSVLQAECCGLQRPGRCLCSTWRALGQEAGAGCRCQCTAPGRAGAASPGTARRHAPSRWDGGEPVLVLVPEPDDQMPSSYAHRARRYGLPPVIMAAPSSSSSSSSRHAEHPPLAGLRRGMCICMLHAGGHHHYDLRERLARAHILREAGTDLPPSPLSCMARQPPSALPSQTQQRPCPPKAATQGHASCRPDTAAA